MLEPANQVIILFSTGNLRIIYILYTPFSGYFYYLCSAMTVAANQPYLFPYLGYFQLIAAADIFVLCDSMQYVRRSFINRNNLLVGGDKFLITAPVRKASREAPINEVEYCEDFLDRWMRTIRWNYAKAPFFEKVMEMLEALRNERLWNVAHFNRRCIEAVCAYLGIDTSLVNLSDMGNISGYDKSDRMIGIVERCGGDRYLNLPGGRALYSPCDFACRGIELKFLEPYLPPYRQMRADRFHPALSILDVMMNCSPQEVREMIRNARFS